MKKHSIFIFLIMICSSLFVSAGSLPSDFLEIQEFNQMLDVKIDYPVNSNVVGSQLEFHERIAFNSNIKPVDFYNKMFVIDPIDLIISVDNNKIEFLIVDTEHLTLGSYNDHMLNIELIAEFTKDKPHINYQF